MSQWPQLENGTDRCLRLLLPGTRNFTGGFFTRPFHLWEVGGQSILAHWLDHAVDARCDALDLYVADEEDREAFRRALRQASLWPLRCRLLPAEKLDPGRRHFVAWGMPSCAHPGEIRSFWDLIRHWRAMENRWVGEVNRSSSPLILNSGVGRHCSIHSTVRIEGPVWIGDAVKIGADSVIGPDVVIGAGSVLEGRNVIRNSRIEPDTYLGRGLLVEDCVVQTNRVLAFGRERIVRDHHGKVCGDLRSVFAGRPSWRERREAAALWCKSRLRRPSPGDGTVSEKLTSEGIPVEWIQSDDVQVQRLRLLREVWRGNLFLYGILPRAAEQWNSLGTDLRDLLSQAPTGAFSLADTYGVHDTSDPRELEFAVRQAALNRENYIPACRRWVHCLYSR